MVPALQHHRKATAIACAVFALYLSIVASAAAKGLLNFRNVLTLTNENFERRTQAASGQTSGHWLVFFCSAHSIQCPMNVPVLEEVAAAGLDVSVAYVDVDDDKPLVQRFGVRSRPHLLLLRGGKMFRYAGDFAGPSLQNKKAVTVDAAVEAITKFVRAPQESSQAETVPPEPGLLLVLVDALVTHLRSQAEKLQQILPDWLFTALPFLILAAVAPLAFYTVMPSKAEEPREKETADNNNKINASDPAKRAQRKNARTKRAE